MNTPVAYKYLTALSDNDLLAEWDRVTDLDPPDYSLEAAIDYETLRRVGEPEVDGTQLLARKLHNEAMAAHNRGLIDRIKELETLLEKAYAKNVTYETAEVLMIRKSDYDRLQTENAKRITALKEILAMKPDPHGDRWEEGYEAAIDECKDVARTALGGDA